MNLFSSFYRDRLLEKLSNTHYDVVVIGGGITGAGIALDAVSRGLKTALIEMSDFASGTSSRSTKLIHGGLRYLKQFEIGLVREVGRERAVVHQLAPHLVRAEKMLLPLTTGGTYSKMATSVGLMVYDVLAGVEKEDQRIMLSKEDTEKLEPMLKADNLEGGGLYAEYRTDDARLTIEVLKTAARYGAHPVNYLKAEEFIYEEGQITGLKCTDLTVNRQVLIRSRFVVNAAGPWVDQVRDLNRSATGKRLHLTKGVHIVVDYQALPVRQAVYFDVPDGRMIFAIPRGQITYIGTTDTDYYGNPADVKAWQEDVDYLIDATNHTFPDARLTRSHVISSWAGLRPLVYEEGKSASEISRRDEIFESPTGLISIAGGKLTGYRKMAERIVDLIGEKHWEQTGKDLPECTTDQIPLCGGVFTNEEAVNEYISDLKALLSAAGLPEGTAEYLTGNYGRQTDQLLDQFNAPSDDTDPDLRLAKAELWFCLHNEMVFSPLDFFERRTGMLYFRPRRMALYLQPLLDMFAWYFKWPAEKLQQESETLEKILYESAHFKPRPR